MQHRKLIVALTAGAALSIDSGCGGREAAGPGVMENPAPPVVEEEPIRRNPAPPIEPEVAALPTWDSVPSGHPEGATNPPRPVLVVDPDGRCFKEWTSGMMAPTPATEDRVQPCPDEVCGTQVQCPPKAAELLKAYEESKGSE